MLDPFGTLSEAGFSQQGDLITAGEDHWTPELIASLDWLRVAELVRAIAAHSGCELARSVVLQDGSVAFAMISVIGGILLALGSSLPISPYVTSISFLIYLICRAIGWVRSR